MLSSLVVSSGWSLSYWSANQWEMWGAFGQKVKCQTTRAYGGLSFKGPQGSASGKKTLEFWIKKNSLGTPDAIIQLGGSSVSGCTQYTQSGARHPRALGP
jgi:hypothetical protein